MDEWISLILINLLIDDTQTYIIKHIHYVQAYIKKSIQTVT